MADNVLVAGIGNIFFGDDAFGVEVAQRLKRIPLSENVQVVDFGIRSYDLAYALMKDWALVILVDALPQGGEPGTVYVFEPDETEDADDTIIDAHAMHPAAVLRLVRALGGNPGRVLVVGCEPARLETEQEGQFGLSPRVHAAVDEAIRLIQKLVVNNSTVVKAA